MRNPSLPNLLYRYSAVNVYTRAQLTIRSISLTFINFGFADYAASQSRANEEDRCVCTCQRDTVSRYVLARVRNESATNRRPK